MQHTHAWRYRSYSQLVSKPVCSVLFASNSYEPVAITISTAGP